MSKVQSEEEALKALQDIITNAKRTSRPSIGRIATVQSMIDLGNDWHDYKEIQKKLQGYLKTGSIFSLQLAIKYPRVFERDPANRVRIAPAAFEILAKNVPRRFKELRNAVEPGEDS